MSRLTARLTGFLLLAGLLTLTVAAYADEAQVCGGYFPSGAKSATPPTTGRVFGLTVLVDFVDYTNPDMDLTDPAVVTKTNDFLNDEDYDQDQNNGSVFTYFRDVSCGALHYHNVLYTDNFFQPTESCEYWQELGSDDPYHDMSYHFKPLAQEIITWLRDVENYDFSRHDANGDGVIDAFNILTENERFTTNGALHPHVAFLDSAIPVGGGLTVEKYQVTHLAHGPKLAIFCHETGHLLMGWPDLYGYGNSAGQATGYCLMGTTYGGNPYQPNGYLKMLAGWVTPTSLTLRRSYDDESTTHASCTLHKIPHPDRTVLKEFYLVENRYEDGRDTSLRESGLAIYAINEDDPTVFTIVQADGNDSLSDSGNLWRDPTAVNFGYSSDPAAIWSDGNYGSFTLDDISAPGATMTFDFENLSVADLLVMIKPQALDAGWTITGPGAFELTGSGVYSLELPVETYTVTFDPVPYWDGPHPESITKPISNQLGGTPTTFTVAYGAPFSLTTGGDIGGAADSSIVVCVLNFDSDPREEIFVGNLNGNNQLLMWDEKTGLYKDSAPSILAALTGIKHAAWGDYDNDGDADGFLVRVNNAHVFLENTALGLVDRTAAAGLSSIGDAFSASWNDVDRDGDLDLFLVDHVGVHTNKLYLNDGAGVFTLHTTGSQQYSYQSLYGIWGDYTQDGYSDLLITAAGDGLYPQPRLNHNLGYGSPIIFEPIGNSGPQGTIDARWADIDLNGVLDIVALDNYGLKMSQGVTFDPWTAHGGVTSGTSLTVADFNNDGLEDMFVTQAGAPDLFILNLGDRNFTTVPIPFTHMEGNCSAAATLDVNGDGLMDLFVTRNGESNFLLINNWDSDGDWLEVRLASTNQIDGAVGARVTLKIGESLQMREVSCGGSPGQDSPTLHFGVVGVATIDTLTVFWGGEQDETILTDVPCNQLLEIDQAQAHEKDVSAGAAGYIATGRVPEPVQSQHDHRVHAGPGGSGQGRGVRRDGAPGRTPAER